MPYIRSQDTDIGIYLNQENVRTKSDDDLN